MIISLKNKTTITFLLFFHLFTIKKVMIILASQEQSNEIELKTNYNSEKFFSILLSIVLIILLFIMGIIIKKRSNELSVSSKLETFFRYIFFLGIFLLLFGLFYNIQKNIYQFYFIID